MGIFGSNKKTYVSSVVYNLAGEEINRPNYLKTTVVSSTINNRPSIAESIVNSYLEGPGMRFRKFAQWAVDSDYNDTIGLVTGTILTGDSIDTEALLDEIPVTPGSVPSLQSAKIGEDDYTYWADQWVSENYPDRLSTDYVSDFDEAANLITITWED